MPIEPRRPLVLDGPEFWIRAANFGNLMAVQEFRDRFFTDPAAVAMEEFGLPATTTDQTKVNSHTYALLTDPGFQNWAEDFQARVENVLGIQPGQEVNLLVLQEAQQRLAQEYQDSIQQYLQPETVNLISVPNQLVAGNNVAVLEVTAVAVAVLVAAVAVAVVVVLAGAEANQLLNRKTLQATIRMLEARDLEVINIAAENLRTSFQ